MPYIHLVLLVPSVVANVWDGVPLVLTDVRQFPLQVRKLLCDLGVLLPVLFYVLLQLLFPDGPPPVVHVCIYRLPDLQASFVLQFACSFLPGLSLHSHLLVL